MADADLERILVDLRIKRDQLATVTFGDKTAEAPPGGESVPQPAPERPAIPTAE